MPNSSSKSAPSVGVSAESASSRPSSPEIFADRSRYHTLDGLRGVAALFVAAYHFGSRNESALFPGYLAVDLFFVLSGFVIALNYSERLRCGMTIRRFAEVRLIRLFPMYAAGFVLGTLKQAVGVLTHDPRALTLPAFACSTAAGIFMLPSGCTEKLFPLNPPSWSLFFEIAVNLLFAVWLWKTSSRAVALLVLGSLGLLALTVGPPLHLNTGWSWATSHIALLRTTFSFPVGVLIYRHFSRRRTVTWAALFPVTAMGLLLSTSVQQSSMDAKQLLTIAVAFPTIVMLGIRFEAPASLARLFNFLGNISYPVYAVHYPLIPFFVFAFTRLKLPPTIQLLLFLAAVIAIGQVAAQIDARVRKRLTLALRSRRSKPAPSTR